MNIGYSFLCISFGAFFSISLYQTWLYFLTRDRVTGQYCIYILSATFTLIPLLSYTDISKPLSAFTIFWIETFWHISLYFYISFLMSVYTISSKSTARRLWVLLSLARGLFIFHGLLALYNITIANTESIFFRNFFSVYNLLMTIYNLIISIYFIVYTLKLSASKFHTLISAGVILNAIALHISIFLKQIHLARLFADIIYLIGVLTDVLLFSIALTYKFKENLEEKTVALSKTLEYQTILHSAEMQKEKEIEISRQAERTKISNDLHDDISGSLVALRLYIDDLRSQIPQIEAQEKVKSIGEEVNAIYLNARQYSHNLQRNTSEADYNLPLILHGVANKFNAYCSLKIAVAIDASVSIFLTTTEQIHLHYIINEALANVVKHANAQKVKISIACDSTTCNFIIADDGTGISDNPDYKNGLGIKSMQNRIRLLNGEIHWQPGTKGTQITGMFPLKNKGGQ